MKKILLIAAFLVASVAAWAGEPHQAYCEIVGSGNFTGTKVKIEVDFGQKVSWMGQKNQRTLVDEQGKKMEFNSMMDAVNYLAQFGLLISTANGTPLLTTESRLRNLRTLLMSTLPNCGNSISKIKLTTFCTCVR